jgi:hypothetical protein
MYYYLSFLRPPPSIVALNALIVIAPQIANDLRTELYEEELDIWYSWKSTNPGSSTRPAKLTTWRGSPSAYKEIQVPPPPRVREGQQWQVLLSSGRTETAAVDLNRPLSFPFGVSSLPIAFSSRNGSSTASGKGKQEQIERTYLVGSNPITIREHTAFDLDKVRVLRCHDVKSLSFCAIRKSGTVVSVLAHGSAG